LQFVKREKGGPVEGGGTEFTGRSRKTNNGTVHKPHAQPRAALSSHHSGRKKLGRLICGNRCRGSSGGDQAHRGGKKAVTLSIRKRSHWGGGKVGPAHTPGPRQWGTVR